jgi:hypothetical protein
MSSSPERDAQLTTVYVTAQLLVESGMTGMEDVRSVGTRIRDSIPTLVHPPSIQAAVQEAPDEYLCPITYNVMKEAVIVVGTGITYEKEAIQAWFARGNFYGKRFIFWFL